MKSCRNCLFPASVPGADLDAGVLCPHCGENKPRDTQQKELLRQACEAGLVKAPDAASVQGNCTVPLFGDKDSCLLIYKPRAGRGLRMLAHTTNINLGEVARANIRRAAKTLDIKHVTYRLSVNHYHRLFAWQLMNQGAHGEVHKISKPGCSRAMPCTWPPRRAFRGSWWVTRPASPRPNAWRTSSRTLRSPKWTGRRLNCSLPREFDLSDLRMYWNPKHSTGARFPRCPAAHHASLCHENTAMKLAAECGLISSSQNACRVASSYPINWLLIYSHPLSFGYTPYSTEFPDPTREVKVSRTCWKRMEKQMDFMTLRKIRRARHVTKQPAWLSLRDEDPRIDRPSSRDRSDLVYGDRTKAAISTGSADATARGLQ